MNLEFNLCFLNVPSKTYIFENENKKRQDVFLEFLEKGIKTIGFLKFLSKMALTGFLSGLGLTIKIIKKGMEN